MQGFSLSPRPLKYIIHFHFNKHPSTKEIFGGPHLKILHPYENPIGQTFFVWAQQSAKLQIIEFSINQFEGIQ